MVNGSEESGAPTIPMLGGDLAGPTEPAPSAPPPGWYPDPWLGSQRRYWTGDRWTLDTVPDAADAGGPPAPPPAWGDPSGGPEPLDMPPERRRGRALIAVATVFGLLVGLGAAWAFSRTRSPTTSTSQPPVSTPGTSPPVTAPNTIQPADSTDPGASSLSRLVVTQTDVATPLIVAELPGGNEVSGQTTLDVCNGTYPSEALRSARLQVAAADPSASDVALSTEAVLYKNAKDTAQAFAELRSVAAHCPSTPVNSPVGDPSVTTHFSAAPDGSWAQVSGVDRLAFSFTTIDAQNTTTSSIAVYLRRGRALLGVYFFQPAGPQPAVDGQTTVAGIVDVFANRMAKLPASVVNGSVT